jgi:hypothetical protein
MDHCSKKSLSALPAMFRTTLISVLTYVLTLSVTLCSQVKTPNEYDVKSAYLYNFGKFVRWPANQPTTDSFSICVLGEDPFGGALNTLSKETLDGKSVSAKRITQPEDAGSCRIIFISLSEEHHLKEILGALDKKPVLTVSEIQHFSRRGGMIQFVMEGNRVRFEVNLTAAEDAGLSLSSELLKVATAVKRNSSPEVDR